MHTPVPHPDTLRPAGPSRRIYIETYGCQMNVGDSEIILSLLAAEGWSPVNTPDGADAILLNTCSIREGAEQRIRARLSVLRRLRAARPGLLVGVVGCMAERLSTTLLEGNTGVDVVAGPDAYRDLPRLLRDAEAGERGANVLLSTEETYGDVAPVRLDGYGVSAFVSIMRGCNNFCSYCVVPYTRGRERSREQASILAEVDALRRAGYREVTLLGQNVNSYRRPEGGFAELLGAVAEAAPSMRVRFATSHPKDLSDRLLDAMAAHGNLCPAIHLPAQSGSTGVLRRMNRGYSREEYLRRVEAIRRRLPGCAVSTDLIAGFPAETEADHALTLQLMHEAAFDAAFLFAYSERPGTRAQRTMPDDVPAAVKRRRLEELIALQNELSLASNLREVGRSVEVLVERPSKRSAEQLFGRTPQNKAVVIDRGPYRPGDRVTVRVERCTSATLFGAVAAEHHVKEKRDV